MSYTNGITIKDTQRKGLNVLNKSIVESVFLKDYKKAYIYKKTEKLSQAMHVVLAHTKTLEGITDRLSTLSVQLIGEVLQNKDETAGSTIILEIISVLQVGETAGVIASKNKDLLIQEYNYLLLLVCEQKVQNIDIDTEIENVEGETKSINTKRVHVKSVQSNSKGHKGQSNNRKGQVLEMIKEHGSLGIKDITKTITDCSEKTVQRLLNTLIKEGFIRKEGERRWSTYHHV